MDPFSVEQSWSDGVEVVRLTSQNSQAAVAVGIGNTLFSWQNRGNEAMWFPYTFAEYLETKSLAGNPLMYPWANRLQADNLPLKNGLFSFEGANVYRDGNGLPLHGLLLKSPYWKTTILEATGVFARHQAIMEVGNHAEYYQIFPFIHRLEMEHVLDNSGLNIHLTVINHDEKPLPLSFGFHPYFSYKGQSRKEIALTLPFSKLIATDDALLPTGIMEEMPEEWSKRAFSIEQTFLDHGFTGIKDNRTMLAQIGSREIRVVLGDAYTTGVVYAPPALSKPYVCLEPMLAPTNALHLEAQGKWSGLKWLSKGESFTASFRLEQGE